MPHTTPPHTRSELYEKLGGEEGIYQIAKRVYQLNTTDPRIRHFFDCAFLERFEKMFQRYLVGLLGGEPYNRHSMVKAHRRLGAVTDSHFDAFLENLGASLAQHGIIEAVVHSLMTIIETTRDDITGRTKIITTPPLPTSTTAVTTKKEGGPPSGPTNEGRGPSCTCSIQ